MDVIHVVVSVNILTLILSPLLHGITALIDNGVVFVICSSCFSLFLPLFFVLFFCAGVLVSLSLLCMRIIALCFT